MFKVFAALVLGWLVLGGVVSASSISPKVAEPETLVCQVDDFVDGMPNLAPIVGVPNEVNLAWAYYAGRCGKPQDRDLAGKLLLKFGENGGDLTYLIMGGISYLRGYGTEPNEAKARDLSRRGSMILAIAEEPLATELLLLVLKQYGELQVPDELREELARLIEEIETSTGDEIYQLAQDWIDRRVHQQFYDLYMGFAGLEGSAQGAYERGLAFVAQGNHVLARDMMWRAGKLGHGKGMVAYATYDLEGTGTVKPDPGLAYQWLLRAKAVGEEVDEFLEEIRPQLSDSDRKYAEKRAREPVD